MEGSSYAESGYIIYKSTHCIVLRTIVLPLVVNLKVNAGQRSKSGQDLNSALPYVVILVQNVFILYRL